MSVDMGNVGLIVAPAIAGYLIARAIGKSAVPPLGVAAVCGAVAAVLSTGLGSIENASFGPVLIVPAFEFSGGALLAITVPMVLLTVADGNLQGFGYLQAQGFRVKANALTIVTGATSVLNALFGGHPAAVGRSSVAIAAGPEAGPAEYRYWAIVIPSVLAIFVAIFAGPTIAVVGALPRAYIVAIAGLAILAAAQRALEASFAGSLRLGPMVAFAVAASSITAVGLSAPIWALVAGLSASLAGERASLQGHWKSFEKKEA